MHSSLAPVSHRPSRPMARAIPAARGPARSRSDTRADAPVVDAESALAAILALLRFVCTLTVVDVLRVAARESAEWHLVVHPSTPAPWIGVAARAFTLLVQVDPRELASLARPGVDVNAPSTLDLLLGARHAPAASTSPRTLASLARSIPEGGALTLALPTLDGDEGPCWSVTVPAGAIVEALDALDAWGVDMERDVELRPRVGVTGDVELVIDGGGSHLWTVAVEPTLDDDPPAQVRVTLPRAEAPLSAETWPTVSELPHGVVAVVGEVG